ncbi:MAG: hypothetical protein RIS54_1994 [Verrucomicrobiota bacterium]|jgi:uncharacterized glyoxalase superfamily protein PhnB
MTPHASATAFQVTNLERALRYYTDVLGFTEDFRFGQYAGIKLGTVHLHLNGNETHLKPVDGSALYILCDEVDAYFETIQAKGAIAQFAPMDEPYGMRDFMIADPDGNHVNFGCELQETADGQPKN